MLGSHDPVGLHKLCVRSHVSFPPFLFEAFLFQPIDKVKSEAKTGNCVTVFTLLKKRDELWEQLNTNIDKDQQRQIREQVILKVQVKAAETSKTKTSRIQQERKYALETMMKLEKEEQDMIQKMKDEECARATAELEVWRETQRKPAEEKEIQLKQKESGKHDNKPIYLNTKRASATPAWLRKQAEARRAVKADLTELKDLSKEERGFSKRRDSEFYWKRYEAAVNAYNLAIKLNRKIPAVFSSRAACHLKLRNLHKAIEDSSHALELLKPAVTADATAHLKAHVRCGTAFCELELYVEGLQDFQFALEIDPHNAAYELIQTEFERLYRAPNHVYKHMRYMKMVSLLALTFK
ncbi:dynein axonemal assembly factor 4-like [Myxocyprinus asiaticus]|uniref:dynein axonemal assembly factor 4-like n=1 Tax=Myxocyprinus asiaticus TaxID=70543 RepID=UPI002222C5F8|nr:dynein axonemal assembly factor 4-like [Myxocyprinus asiaticus]